MLPLLHKQINYIDECVGLLTKHVNHETDEAYIDTYCQDHGIARELVAPLFDAPIAIAQHVLSKLEISAAQLNRFFLSGGKEGHSIADFFIYSYNDVSGQDVFARLAAHSPRQRLEYLYQIAISVCEGRIVPAGGVPDELTMEGLLRMIVQDEPDNAPQNMRLLDFCLNTDELAAQLAPILNSAVVLFKEKEHLVLPQLQQVWAQLEDLIASKGMGLITHLMPMSGQFPRPYHVFASVMMPHSLRYSIALDDANEHFVIGLNVMALETLEKQHENPAAIAEAFKTLGDKTKLDILQALKTRPMYGQELATLLNLSTATISYHMNLLLKHDFVMVERENARIYYQMNLPSLKRHFKRMEALLGIEGEYPPITH